ncbi:unnamed protein product [Caenorhabditis angaria]|uniref:CSD domain-containing protein n=1 Tax=Caenorhabditis angaria TaxID=860376 RepID=A0A9P1IIP1_9PELO|nr:unnamed protein product [Caenorhabditis angaria]
MSTTEIEKSNINKDEADKVAEKLADLNVDNTKEANGKPARRNFTGRRGGYRGRGGRGGRRNFVPRIPYEEQLKKIEEEQKNKKVIETGVNGYVKWFSVRGRYGFVARENGKENEKDDYFVHQSAIIKSSTIKVYLRTLDDGEKVVFDIVEGAKGLEAANITGPDGENVRGSKYSRQLLWRFRRPNGPPRRQRATDDGAAEKDNKNGDEAQNTEAGEARGAQKRRPRRARGKLAPNAQNEGVEKVGNGHKEDQGNGDGSNAVVANGEKKGNRRTNKNKNRNNKKGDAKQVEGGDDSAAPKLIDA